MLLENKNAVINGGGGHIGSAVARAFAREGARVFLAGRSMTRDQFIVSLEEMTLLKRLPVRQTGSYLDESISVTARRCRLDLLLLPNPSFLFHAAEDRFSLGLGVAGFPLHPGHLPGDLLLRPVAAFGLVLCQGRLIETTGPIPVS